MRLNRTLRLGFAMLLTLMLPLQGYAAMSGCGQRQGGTGSSAAGAQWTDAGVAASPTAQHHCEHANTAGRHCCDHGCCGTAIAQAPVQWIAPPLNAPQVFSALPWPPPTVALDRLDRPPRFIPA
jgi:hypothetical protein